MKPPIRTQIAAFLNDSTRSLIEIYLDIQRLGEHAYGENTLVLIEIGSFFEVYGIDNEQEKIGKPKEVADILNLQLTRKNKSIVENSVQNPLLAGFPTATFDRYINRLLQEQTYTIIVIRQQGILPNITRYLDCILSPGVHFEYVSSTQEDSVVCSLTIDEHKGVYSVGLATADVTTGKTSILEAYSTQEDPTFALDELFRVLQTHTVSEVLLTLLSPTIQSQEIIEYVELHHPTIKLNTHRLDILYQNELFKQIYSIESMLSPIEYLNLERQPLASEALALLLEFIIEHDYDVVQSLNIPQILNTQSFLYLGNNPLEQLNIISKNPDDTTVLNYINYTSTSIGYRLLKNRLLYPITDANELNARYDLADHLQPLHQEIHAELKNIYDLERLLRRIQLSKLHPFEMNFLYDTLAAIYRIIGILEKTDQIEQIGGLIQNKPLIGNCMTLFEQTFNLQETAKFNMHDIAGSLFQQGVYPELDILVEEKDQLDAQLEIIRQKIIQLIQETTKKDEGEYVQIKQLDKEGHYIHLTKSRYVLIQHILKETFISIDGTVYALSDFSYKVQTSNVKITAPLIDRISERIQMIQSKMSALVKELFIEQLKTVNDDFGDTLKNCIVDIAKIDVAMSTIRSAIELKLVRPEILSPEPEKSQGESKEKSPQGSIVELIQVRHPLVEALEENGLYVPNDIVLGNQQLMTNQNNIITQMGQQDVRGVLLYGINSSGKSSFMKSIGICVILAQAGLFVPAQQMRFTLFYELFTRIVARDHFERGLSSFAVEMMELKNIFNRCSARSLILGDEISHGTETLSAIAIVTAAILRLSELNAFFLFATHLHQLQDIQDIQLLKHVVSVHLSVRYDKENDTMIFDRTLQPGSGSSIYGLEFAQSLHMDNSFLKTALRIRKELSGEFEPLELLTKKQRSKYNTNVLLTKCAVCQKTVDDTHHITPQHLADEYGYIGHIPKDHKFNLIPLCKLCHTKVHTGKLTITGFTRTTKGWDLKYEEK